MPAAAVMPSTFGIAGAIAPVVASPMVAVAATVMVPSEARKSSPRSLDLTNPCRSGCRTAQAWSSAFAGHQGDPDSGHTAAAAPEGEARVLPAPDPTWALICAATIGIGCNVEWRTCFWKEGSPWQAKPSTQSRGGHREGPIAQLDARPAAS